MEPISLFHPQQLFELYFHHQFQMHHLQAVFFLFFLHTFDHILHVIILFCLSYQSDNRILINISVNASSTHSGATTIKNQRQHADLLD